VQNFINELKKTFVVKIEEVEIIKENIIFKTPAKLN
jgi:4-hydroxy-3-methylbut-2-enyl diphosphate reductase